MKTLLVVGALSISACATEGISGSESIARSVAAVQFGPPSVAWRAADYLQVRELYTRHAFVNHEFDATLDVSVTLLSPDFRAAFVEKMAAMQRLTGAEKAALVESQRKDAESAVEVIVVAQTGRWDWNDFTSTRSMWNVTLTDDQGRQSGAPQVVATSWKQDEFAELFPGVTPFSRGWRMRFPKAPQGGSPELGPDTRRLELRFAGALGDTKHDLRWQAAR